ncbi:MAG: hypothetical protein H0V34_11960 [Gammaproteobacteria bacterium]|nr:hypothetical protein [Gammaproteobacteria bacterium]
MLMEDADKRETEPAVLDNATPQALFDYFASEIFDRAPAELRELWLRTACLPRFTAAMARRLTGNAKAEGLLGDLYCRRYFIDQRSASEPHYQYHALFREFLGHQVMRVFTEAERQQLVHKSARTLEEHGDHEAALALYKEARDWTSAVRLIVTMAPSVLAQGRWKTLGHWITSLPRQTVEETTWLLFWSGACKAQSDSAAGQKILERAYTRFTETRDTIGQALSAAAVIDSYFVDTGGFTAVAPWIDALEEVLAHRPVFASSTTELRAWSSMLIALCHLKPGHAFTPVCAERVRQLCRLDIGAGDRLMAASALLHYMLVTGDLPSAAATAVEFAPLAKSPKATPFQRLAWSWAYALYLMVAADCERSLGVSRHARELASQHGLSLLATMHRAFEIWALLIIGDVKAASELLDASASEFIGPARCNDVAIYHFLRSWEALLLVRPQTARKRAEKAAELTEQLGHTGPAICTSGTHSQALADCGELDRALAVARNARQGLGGLKSGHYRFSALLFEADVLRQMGRREEFLATLSEALATGRRGEYLGCLQWLPRMMTRLCAEALKAGVETEYVQHLIRERGLVADSPEVVDWPWPIKIYTLGRFSLLLDSAPTASARKTPKKPIALLKFIIAAGGRQVPLERAVDALWPDEEGDATQKSFQISLYRLRKLLQYPDAVLLQEGRLSLNAALCWVDAWAFERLAARTDPTSDGQDNGRPASVENTLTLYQGNFLAHDLAEPWTMSRRERLRISYIRLVAIRASALIEAGDLEAAIDSYRRGLAADDLAEGFYLGIMRCYQRLKRPAEGLAAYQRLRQMLSIKLGVEPSHDSRSLAKALRAS